MAMGADYSFEVISIETCMPQFNGHNKSFLGSVTSSLVGFGQKHTFADSITHILHRSIFTALRSALLSGEPLRTLILGKFWSIFHSSENKKKHITYKNMKKKLIPNHCHIYSNYKGAGHSCKPLGQPITQIKIWTEIEMKAYGLRRGLYPRVPYPSVPLLGRPKGYPTL